MKTKAKGKQLGVAVRVRDWLLSHPWGSHFTMAELPLYEGEALTVELRRSVNEAVSRMRKNGADIRVHKGQGQYAFSYTYHGSKNSEAILLRTVNSWEVTESAQMDDGLRLMARAVCLPFRKVPELFGDSL